MFKGKRVLKKAKLKPMSGALNWASAGKGIKRKIKKAAPGAKAKTAARNWSNVGRLTRKMKAAPKKRQLPKEVRKYKRKK